MKANLKIIITVIAIIFLSASCSNAKDSVIDEALAKMEKTLNEMEQNMSTMTEEEIEAYAKELQQSVEVLKAAQDSNQVSMLKALKITGVMVRYTAVVMQSAVYYAAPDSVKVRLKESGITDSIAAATKKLQNAFESNNVKKKALELEKTAGELKKEFEKELQK